MGFTTAHHCIRILQTKKLTQELCYISVPDVDLSLPIFFFMTVLRKPPLRIQSFRILHCLPQGFFLSCPMSLRSHLDRFCGLRPMDPDRLLRQRSRSRRRNVHEECPAELQCPVFAGMEVVDVFASEDAYVARHQGCWFACG